MFETSEVNPEKLPRHIAVIMDGNGRWAAARGLPRILGHRAGADAVHRIVEACCEVGVQALTLYAFSWENWSRPSEEIRDLMELLDEFLTHEVERLRVNQIRLRAIGRLTTLPPEVLAHLNRLMASTSRFSRMTLTLALSYGGRQEIVDAVRRIAQEVQEGRVRPEHIDERLFHEYLYLPELPDPDLLIRTSGEQRVSNFLLWQASYSELYVTPQLWPDFGKEDLLEAIVAYQKRERRFGATVQAASSKPQASGRKLQTTEEGDKSLRPPDCPEAWSLKPVAYLKPGA
ncbi:MAG: isoprenyl transferase [Candidatus Omnitrophica bacterium]|nr:isoprenyl transferase [Candidatus Omnitrophota bacterium]